MNNLISQVSYPVFLYMTFVFFLIAAVFSFVVGIALALRSEKALRFFDWMNRWISIRRMMRPLSTPHYIEPVLLKRRVLLGTVIIIGAMASIQLLAGADLRPALSLLDDNLTVPEIAGVAENLKEFLIAGNAICMLVGILVVFFPRVLSTLESYTDRWLTLRKSMQPLDRMHMDVDNWVLKHPTSAGFTLSILSFSDGTLIYNQLQNLLR
jgi:hypothetical protein